MLSETARGHDVADPPALDAPVTGGAAGRAVWTTADQVVSSLASAALSIVLARTVSAAQFGTFALAFSVYTFAVGVAQAVGGQVLVIRYTDAPPKERRVAVGLAAGNAVRVGALAALVLLAALPLVRLPSERVVLAVAVLLPALLLQDAWRTVLISAGTPRSAFLNDLLWTVLQLVAIGLLLARGEHQALWYVLAWGGSAVVAAALGVRQARVAPRLRGGVRWAREHRQVTGYLLAQWVAVLGAIQIAFVVLAALGGVQDVGSLRAAQTLLGPLNILGMAATSFAVPELVRARPGRRGLVLTAAAVSALMVVAVAAWGAVLLLLPASAGRQLLGDTWDSARVALPGMVLFTCAVGITTGPSVLFRALDRSNYTFFTSAALGPLILVLSVVGQAVGGVRGAAYGFALAAALVVVPFFVLAGRAVRAADLPAQGA
ncbi:MAG: rane protein [Frankiales bacterium]|nr:rane protein [Frankiales bacterium]